MKILIVDDEPDIATFFEQLAQARGFEDVDKVGSGEEALTQVVRRSYDLITLDIQMPGASGLEILSLLRNMCPHAIIAIISAHIPGDLADNVAGCADTIIEKPVPLEAFNTLIDNVHRVSQSMAEIRQIGIDLPAARSKDAEFEVDLEEADF